jgi:GrpB-like predicted nucleotidyltransferase (UPF0157 family)
LLSSPINRSGRSSSRKFEIQEILKGIPILSIEHVGSTSIPGFVAKPVLDIDIVVMPETLPATRAAMASAGYTDLGERGVPDRYSFLQPGYEWDWERERMRSGPGDQAEAGEMRRNTYVVLEGSIALKNHRDLKRVLLEDEKLREEYGNVKKRMVAGGVQDIDEYCRGKNLVMFKILESAGWTEDELEVVRKVNE